MKLDLFVQKTSNLQLKNQMYRFAVIVIALAVVVNSYYTYKFLNEQRIVVMAAVHPIERPVVHRLHAVLNRKICAAGDFAEALVD